MVKANKSYITVDHKHYFILISSFITWNNQILFKFMLTWFFLAAGRWKTQHSQKMFHSSTSHQIKMVPCQNTFPQVFVHDPEYRVRTWCECFFCTTALLHWQRSNGLTPNDHRDTTCAFRKWLHPVHQCSAATQRSPIIKLCVKSSSSSALLYVSAIKLDN